MTTVDLLIVGAGPVGLFGLYYAGFRGMSTAVLDSLEEPGGQVTALYPEKLIYDVAGFPAVKGRELVDNLVAQAAPFEPAYLLGERGDTLVEQADGTWIVITDKGRKVAAKAIIITGGLGTFTPRQLPVGEHYLGRGLSYFVKSLEEHRDKDVVVVGGGDSAFDWALNLHPIAKSVTLVHRRDKFRAHEHTISQVRGLGVPIHTFAEVTAIHGSDTVAGVTITPTQGGDELTQDAQTVIAALGFTADLGPLADWGLGIERKQILVDTTMLTNRPGIFAAGDIVEYPGKVRLIAVGFGEVATAVNNAAPVIDPGAKVFPGHSSDPG